jgi:hypothetical protein
MVLLPMALSACAASDDGKPITFTDDRGVSNQPFPNNFRTEVLAFLKTYLNNPSRGGRRRGRRSSASSADGCATGLPSVQPTRTDGGYREPRERALSSSTAGSTASSKTPASPVPARLCAIRGMEKLTR